MGMSSLSFTRVHQVASGMNIRLVALIALVAVPAACLWLRPYTSTSDSNGSQIVNVKTLAIVGFNRGAGTSAHLPNGVRKLDGKWVRMSGYLYRELAGDIHAPTYLIDDFVGYWRLPPPVHERVALIANVQLPELSRYTSVEVCGILRLCTEKRSDLDDALGIFELDVDTVRIEQ